MLDPFKTEDLEYYLKSAKKSKKVTTDWWVSRSLLVHNTLGINKTLDMRSHPFKAVVEI